MKRSMFFLVGFITGLILIFTTGCTKDFIDFEDIRAPKATELTATIPEAPSLRDELAGEWLFTSYNINGIEYMGTVVKSAKFKFEAITLPDAQYEQEIFFYEGGYDKFFGIYRVNEELGTLTLVCGPQTSEGKLHFENGVKMMWKGMHGTVPVVITAKRNFGYQ